MTSTRVIVAASLGWLALVAGLIVRADRRDLTPGEQGPAPATWPAASSLALAREGVTLVMLAHPRCPCTVVSLDELERLLRDAAGPARAYVLLVRPADAPADFERGPAFERARGMHGVQAVVDVDGREAARFGARTSGHVVAYDAGGGLRFAGGLTAARGHGGDSPGRRALLSLLAGAAAPAGALVFGCPLSDGGPQEEPSEAPRRSDRDDPSSPEGDTRRGSERGSSPADHTDGGPREAR